MLKENLFKALAAVLILIAVTAALGYWFDEQMRMATNWIVERIGFAGLCLILFVTDTLVTPIGGALVALRIDFGLGIGFVRHGRLVHWALACSF